MWWLIFLYIIPGMITTILLPRFIEYQGGQEFLKITLENYDEEYYSYYIVGCSLFPIINILFAVLMIYWSCTGNF